MKLSSVQTLRPSRTPGVVAFAASSSSVTPMRPLVVRNRPINDVPAHPSLETIPESLWVPTTGARSEAERPLPEHVWCEALPDHLNSEDTQHCAHPPLMMQMDGTTLFRVQVDEPPAPPGRQKNPDFYANVGDAIRTLREDYPQLFYKELNYSIYREDITFRDPRLSFTGMKNYQLIFWSLRFHGRLFFSKLYVDVLRIWQPEDHQIKIRWRIVGIPRVWWKAEGTIDGISTYKLDNDGKIYEHLIDNVQLRDPPIRIPALYGLNYILSPGLQGQTGQVPCPGSWFTNGDGAAVPLSSSYENLTGTAEPVLVAAAESISSHSLLNHHHVNNEYEHRLV